MGALTDLLTTKVRALQAERARMVSNHDRELAQIDAQITQLQGAASVISGPVEAAYEALLAQGLIQPVNR